MNNQLKEKLGLCLYEDICDEKEFILMSEESFIEHDVENKQLKEKNKKLNANENENENKKFEKNKMVKDANIKKLIEEPKEIKSPKWLDKKMVEYNKVNVKLSDSQLKKLKNVAKNKTGATLRISLKMFNRNNLPHELLLTTRQKTKVRNAFNNNTSMW